MTVLTQRRYSPSKRSFSFELLFKSVILSFTKKIYSNHLNTRLVRISNGRILNIWFSNPNCLRARILLNHQPNLLFQSSPKKVSPTKLQLRERGYYLRYVLMKSNLMVIECQLSTDKVQIQAKVRLQNIRMTLKLDIDT